MDTATLWVALLRGVNVGGARRLNMADLRTLAEAQGWQAVRTYLASGNLVFRAAGDGPDLAAALQTALADRFGLEIAVLVLPGWGLRMVRDGCPFAEADPARIHAVFLSGEPDPDMELYEDLREADEALVLDGRVAWLHTPGGLGKSRLGARIEAVLRDPQVTARNLRTLQALSEMVDG